MKIRALECWLVAAVVSCGQGPPTFYLSHGAFEDADTPAHDEAGAVRILSDVTAPRESDGRSSAVVKDASMGEREGNLPDEGGHDVRADGSAAQETGPEAATRRDAATGDAAGDAATRDTATDHAAIVDIAGDGPVTDAAAADAAVSHPTIGDETSREGGGDVLVSTDADAVEASEADANVNAPDRDACLGGCAPLADHLLISEVVTRPIGAELIEITNPTRAAIDLSDYVLSDSHLYYKIATDEFTTASGSDFAARFPSGSVILPGQYVVMALANASGGSANFEATYGTKPDFELRPTANGAVDDPKVPNMSPAQPGPSIGATCSLTDGGEPIVLFFYRSGSLVYDADYLYFGAPTSANPVVDKTAVVVTGSTYHDDTAAAWQHPVAAPAEGGSIHRCVYAEVDETRFGGNGLTGHDETGENASETFVLGSTASERTPGAPAPPRLCNRASIR